MVKPRKSPESDIKRAREDHVQQSEPRTSTRTTQPEGAAEGKRGPDHHQCAPKPRAQASWGAGHAGAQRRTIWPASQASAATFQVPGWKGRRRVTHLVQRTGLLGRAGGGGGLLPDKARDTTQGSRKTRATPGHRTERSEVGTRDPGWSRQEVRSGRRTQPGWSRQKVRSIRGTQGEQAGSEVRTPMPAQGEKGPTVIIFRTKSGFIKPATQDADRPGQVAGAGCKTWGQQKDEPQTTEKPCQRPRREDWTGTPGLCH